MVEARQALDRAYGWLESRLQHRTWAAGEDFTMADCAAAPSLFTPTGCTRSGRILSTFVSIVRSCGLDLLSLAPLKRVALIDPIFHSALPTEIDTRL